MHTPVCGDDVVVAAKQRAHPRRDALLALGRVVGTACPAAQKQLAKLLVRAGYRGHDLEHAAEHGGFGHARFVGVGHVPPSDPAAGKTATD